MFVRKRFSLFGGVAATLLVVYAAVLPAATAFAQTAPVRPPLNLMTSPLPLNVVTTPGKPVTADIRVKNNGGQPELLKVELLKFGADNDTGQPKLLDREPTDRYFDWVTFSETSFTAEPNVWKTVKMTISPPKEAAFGYYYAVVFSRANPFKPTGGASGVEGGLASLVLLTVEAPGARRSVEVARLTATQKVYEFLPARFTVKLRNKGNVHVSPVGTLFIKRGGTQVATLGFNQTLGNILPGTNRDFEIEWKDGFPSYVTKGTGEAATRELKWDFGKIQNLRFGRYTGTLVAVYDDGKKDVPIEAEVSFWVVPWRILGVILLIVLLVGGGLWAVFRTIWRNIRKQIIRIPPAAPAGAPAPGVATPAAPAAPLPPVVDEEPDESSLAAHLRRKKEKKEAKKLAKQEAASQKAAAAQAVVPPPEPAPAAVPSKPAAQQARDQSARPLSKKQLKKQKQAAAAAARQEATRKAAEEAAAKEAKRRAEEAEREAKRKAEEARRKAAEEARRAAAEAEKEAKRQAAAAAARKAEEARLAAEKAAAEAARLAEQAALAAAPSAPQPAAHKPASGPQPHKKKNKKNKHQGKRKRNGRS